MRTTALVAAVMLAIGARADEKAVRKELEHTLALGAKAFLHKDLKTLEAGMAPDYRAVTADGRTITKQESLAQMKMVMAMASTIERVDFKLRSLTVQWNMKAADARVDTCFAGTMLDDKGKGHPVTLSGPTRQLWVKTAGGWKLKQLKDMGAQTMTMDGKPFNLNAMTGPSQPKRK